MCSQCRELYSCTVAAQQHELLEALFIQRQCHSDYQQNNIQPSEWLTEQNDCRTCNLKENLLATEKEEANGRVKSEQESGEEAIINIRERKKKLKTAES